MTSTSTKEYHLCCDNDGSCSDPIKESPAVEQNDPQQYWSPDNYDYFASTGFRILLHAMVSCYIFFSLCELNKPLLGTVYPVSYYFAIGLIVPWEFYAVTSFLLICIFPLIFTMETIYTILLLLTVFMTSAVGFLKFRSLVKMEKENSLKKGDDLSPFDATMDPVEPGSELDRLRLIESQLIRERKSMKESARAQAIAYAGVPLESVDVVV